MVVVVVGGSVVDVAGAIDEVVVAANVGAGTVAVPPEVHAAAMRVNASPKRVARMPSDVTPTDD